MVRTAGIVERRAAATPRNMPPMLGSSTKVVVVMLLEFSLFAGCPEAVVAGLLAGVGVVVVFDGCFDSSIVERGTYNCLQTLQSLSSLRI